ncbi:MAG: hypothetical protein EBX41_00865 [Chitinophagia bacterium]|nr:hypothetical protein [Chitinophagia bacterium]
MTGQNLTGAGLKQLTKKYRILAEELGEAFGKPPTNARQFGYSLFQRLSFKEEELRIIIDLVNKRIIDLGIPELPRYLSLPDNILLPEGLKKDAKTPFELELPVLDNTMLPEYAVGGVLLLSEVKDNFIINGNSYVLATKSHVLIRKWHYNDSDSIYTGYTLDNQTAPITLHRSDITAIYTVLEYRKPEQNSTIAMLQGNA